MSLIDGSQSVHLEMTSYQGQKGEKRLKKDEHDEIIIVLRIIVIHTTHVGCLSPTREIFTRFGPQGKDEHDLLIKIFLFERLVK